MSNEPEPNIPLLRKAVEWAEVEAARTDGGMWNQKRWAVQTDCGAAYCIAGYVATVAEPQLTVRPGGWENGLESFVDGEFRFWDDIAIDHLRITEDEADDLFDSGNTIERVRIVAERIAERAGDRL